MKTFSDEDNIPGEVGRETDDQPVIHSARQEESQEPDQLLKLEPPVLEAALRVDPLFPGPQEPAVSAAASRPLFQCEQCGANFPSGRQLSQHMRRSCGALLTGSSSPSVVALGSSKYTCDTCGVSLANRTSLELHLRSHTGYRPFACDKCDKTFTSAGYLRQHSVFHNAAKEFECEVCGKRYQNANSLHQHRKDSHSSPPKVACPDCGKIFAAVRYLTEHQTRKHSASFRRPACPVCGKTFAGRTELATHQTMHTGERPFGCNFCGKRFRLKSVLCMHIRSHAGERSAVCDTCGKRFLQASDLNKHKLAAHSGEKPFSCEICARPFARRDYLKAHMKVHQQQHHLAEENGINNGMTVKRMPRTRKVAGRNRNMVEMMEMSSPVEDAGRSRSDGVYSPDIEQSLILDVPMALSSIVEGSETLLVVTNLDDSKDLVVEEFKSDSLMTDSSGFL